MPDSINNYNGPFRPRSANLTRKSDSVSNRIESNAFQFNERKREQGGKKFLLFNFSILLRRQRNGEGELTLRKNCLFFHWNSKEGSLTTNERRLKAAADFKNNYFSANSNIRVFFARPRNCFQKNAIFSQNFEILFSLLFFFFSFFYPSSRN